MRIEARGIDPTTGEPDRHGVPQIACPARQDEVNPQFTCRSCPSALRVETHPAIDDRGGPFYMVDAVECGFEGEPMSLPARLLAFPSFHSGMVKGAPSRVESGVACPLLARPDRAAPISLAIEGVRWVPIGNCRTCQFYRGTEGKQNRPSSEDRTDVGILCAAPLAGNE